MSNDLGDPRALLLRYAAGNVDESEEAQVHAALADPALRRFYADVLMHGVLLGELAEERRLQTEMAEAKPGEALRLSSKRPSIPIGRKRRSGRLGGSQSRRRFSVVGLAAAAGLVLLVGVVALFRQDADHTVPGPDPRKQAGIRLVEANGLSLSGPGGALATTGTQLPPGCELSGSAQASGLIAFPDGSTLALKPGGIRVQINGPRRIRLGQGTVEAQVVKQPEDQRFSISTDQAEVAVIGTRFSVSAEAAGTSLRVDEGSVRFAEPGTGRFREVSAGNAAAAGHGLLGIYYHDQFFRDEVFRRVDAKIMFWWGANAPDPRLGSGTFGVRWLGWLMPAHDEEYTLYAVADDAAKVWVDGVLVVNNTKGWDRERAKANRLDQGQVRLKKGVPARIAYEMFQNFGSSFANLEWSCPAFTKQVIPSECLLPDPETAASP